ncbi:MAG: prepilin-type N-terminal cleavage/methylation domain-containing protein [Betaproteobacteria bacterium]
MKSNLIHAHHQSGSSLLEALVAILIFSIGILAIVGLLSTSIRASSEAKYRSDANLLVNDVLGQMQVSDPLTLVANFKGQLGSGGPGYLSWYARVKNSANSLPNAAAYPPVIDVNAAGNVQVKVYWLAPGDASPQAHNLIVQTLIR